MTSDGPDPAPSALPPSERSDWRVTVGGAFVSLLAHAALLFLGGCFDALDVAPPSEPLAVEIWSPQERTHPLADDPPTLLPRPEPLPAPNVVEPDVSRPAPIDYAPVEDMASPILDGPTFTTVVPDEPLELDAPPRPPALELPPAEIETPALDFELADLADALGPPPLEGELSAPPAGPAPAERRRELDAAAATRARASESRLARVLQTRTRAPAAPPSKPRAPEVDGPLAAEEGVEGPLGKRRLVYRESPPYPEWARRRGLEAEVKFRIWVNPNGVVSRVSITKRSGNTTLDELAARALRAWRFEPLPAHVSQRDEWGEVPMSFRLVRSDR